MEDVELRRDDEVLTIFLADDLPPAFVDHPVMAMAEKDEVFQVGLAASGPMLEMVRDRVRTRPVAAGPPASPVSNSQRTFQRGGDDPLRASDVDHLRLGAEKDAGHAAVARESRDAGGRDGQGAAAPAVR